jgi:hypothetical protein
LAKKLLAEMEAAEALKKLAEAAKIASDSLITAFGQLSKATKDLLLSFGLSPNQVGPGGTIITEDKSITGKAGLQGLSPNNPLFFTSPETTSLGLSLGFTPGIQPTSSPEPMDIRLTIDGGSDKLSQAIAESIQLATRSGYNTIPAGFLV